ncbi:MAG: hypothetical protein PHN31_00290 [Candidatus Gracilibacteria bacterium]|nr:hypothetical protein [Candidatus Gracilibacteria bacterium]
MKIFNNFDSKFKEKEYNEAIKNYGEENVLLVQRCIAYLIIKGWIPLFLYIILIIPIIIGAYFLKTYTYVFRSIVTVLSIFSLSVLYKFFLVYLDYKYDFSIFTCKRIFTYKQEGLLNSDFKDLPAEKIRSIVSSRNGLIGNIFGYGSVEIYTDGQGFMENEDEYHERSHAGKTKLTYVYRPNKIRQRILRICVINPR